jgi:hypothetical protein
VNELKFRADGLWCLAITAKPVAYKGREENFKLEIKKESASDIKGLE